MVDWPWPAPSSLPPPRPTRSSLSSTPTKAKTEASLNFQLVFQMNNDHWDPLLFVLLEGNAITKEKNHGGDNSCALSPLTTTLMAS